MALKDGVCNSSDLHAVAEHINRGLQSKKGHLWTKLDRKHSRLLTDKEMRRVHTVRKTQMKTASAADRPGLEDKLLQGGEAVSQLDVSPHFRGGLE